MCAYLNSVRMGLGHDVVGFGVFVFRGSCSFEFLLSSLRTTEMSELEFYMIHDCDSLKPTIKKLQSPIICHFKKKMCAF